MPKAHNHFIRNTSLVELMNVVIGLDMVKKSNFKGQQKLFNDSKGEMGRKKTNFSIYRLFN